ncbi:MAG: C25 family cysteine peptidase [Euryarchaeota archaeon]|nr:C25 family cysteine peptidase [Euryarchaeota archaeon]
MKRNLNKKIIVIVMILSMVLSSGFSAVAIHTNASSVSLNPSYTITKTFVFSTPRIDQNNESVSIFLNESDLNRLNPGKPVVPVNLTQMEFPLGTEITNIIYEHSTPEIIPITHPLVVAMNSLPDNMQNVKRSLGIYGGTDPYPADWVSSQTGGGLSKGNHTTFFVLRVYPVRYFPLDDHLEFIRQINVTITVKTPVSPVVNDNHVYDLLIIAPKEFIQFLQPLVCHKNQQGLKTKLVTLDTINQKMFWQGRDSAEKIKYFIKDAIESWGIDYVLLVGGHKGQSFSWYLPVRYSHVAPEDDQVGAEQSFLSDLYYADIYDSKGQFCSWDSNGNSIFAEWRLSQRDEMDLYPDVYLGRLACTSKAEVKVVVDKIISYEQTKSDDQWFNRMVLIAGDSYNDTNGFIEGELATEEAAKHMLGFTAVKVWTSEQDINKKTVKNAVDPGCGFIYFCGHGNPSSWSTHFPPNGTLWCTGFENKDVYSLKNGYKLPVVVVGGCHNAQFNTTLANIAKGIRESGFSYFSRRQPFGDFWYNEWIPNCWAWLFVRKNGGGAIATIANTGLGTHGSEDFDNNTVPDYLEVLDGWLEIRFFQLYGEGHVDMLGATHGQALTGYLNRFLGNEDKWDVKIVQQWELLGDPSLKIGGYE